MNFLVMRSFGTAKLINNFSLKQTACISVKPSTRASSSTQDFRPSEELAKERYSHRADEDIEKKRARLLYQSRKRGMLENGVILATFADKYLNKFDADQLDEYDRLINLPTNDWDIFHWATKTKPTPLEFETKVMQKLREHIDSKVSNNADDQEQSTKSNKKQNRISILDGRDPNEIVMPAVKQKYDIDVDVRDVSLTDYDKELFDTRTKTYRRGLTAAYMTEWRKNQFLRRIKRTLGAPVSLRNLSDEKKVEAFSQMAPKKELGVNDVKQCANLLDTKTERTLKHHNFLQHLLSSTFTDNPLEYDDEAEAWAELVWHRDYGRADLKLAPSSKKCSICRAKLHCCDPAIPGYLPKELFILLENNSQASSHQNQCQKCKFSNNYNVSLGCDVNKKLYDRMCEQFRLARPSVICLLVDLTDLPSGIYDGFIDKVGYHHKIIVVGNKLDLLPNDGNHMIGRVTRCLRQNLTKLRIEERNLFLRDVMVISARTGFGVEGLVTRLLTLSQSTQDIYLMGCANSGKSTLFSALLQSDMSAVRQGDIISRVADYECPGTGIRMLKFPINQVEGWELELKKRRCGIVERNIKKYEESLQSSTMKRQENTPHMSMLIDRLSYLPRIGSDLPATISSNLAGEALEIKFEENHPMATLPTKYEPIAISDHNGFTEHSFVHQTPSLVTNDQLHNLLTDQEKLETYAYETISPRKYSIRPLQTIFIAGLARLDLLTSTSSVLVTIFASKYLPIHVISTRKADQFYYTFLGSSYLGPPYNGKDDSAKRRRLDYWPKLESSQADFLVSSKATNYDKNGKNGSVDVVFSSAGWALIDVGPDQECLVRAYTPEGRGIHVRNPPLLPFARSIGRTGKKIRDTPLYSHPKYIIESVSA